MGEGTGTAMVTVMGTGTAMEMGMAMEMEITRCSIPGEGWDVVIIMETTGAPGILLPIIIVLVLMTGWI